MFTKDFESKLKKVNPRLFIDYSRVRDADPATPVGCGLYLREQRDSPVRGIFDGKDKQWAEEYNSRSILYLGWVSYPSVPTGDLYNLDTGVILSPGWRSVLKKLISKKAITKEKAKKVFDYEESSYDRFSRDEKIAFQKRWGV